MEVAATASPVLIHDASGNLNRVRGVVDDSQIQLKFRSVAVCVLKKRWVNVRFVCCVSYGCDFTLYAVVFR